MMNQKEAEKVRQVDSLEEKMPLHEQTSALTDSDVWGSEARWASNSAMAGLLLKPVFQEKYKKK